jgi:hypothetical protein
MLTKTTHVEALMQTPEQRLQGTVTYRIYTDDAWRNVEGLNEWKQLTQAQLIALVEQVYEKNKPRRTA